MKRSKHVRAVRSSIIAVSTLTLAAGCAGESGAEHVGEAASALTVWQEPLPSDPSLDYPVIGNPTGPWEDGVSDSQMTSIGHSCAYLQPGSTCGDGVCQASEGTDPTSCWEDCVKQPWCNGTSCVSPGTPDKLLDKVVLYGVSTARLWSTDPQTGEITLLVTDTGYLPVIPLTSNAGYGSQLLFVRKLNQPRNGEAYCVEKRFRGRDLDAGPLSWTHTAEKTHDNHVLVTHTNGSQIYKLDGGDLHPLWKLDGLHFDTGAANNGCEAGPSPSSCCTTGGCDISFTEDGGLSGGISYENMVREVNDGGTYRYVISNRDWHTIVMVDAQSATNSPPVVASGTNHGKVSWAFGLHKSPAVTSNDLCQLSLPHGVKFFTDTGKLYEADLAIGRVIEIPYNHGCYLDSATPKATLIDGTAPNARAVERSTNGTILFTQNPSEGSLPTRKYPVEEDGGAWRLKANMVYHGGLAGSFAFDLQALPPINGTRYLVYTGPTCKSSTLGSQNWAREGVLTLWTEFGTESTPFFMYPSAGNFVNSGAVCDGSY